MCQVKAKRSVILALRSGNLGVFPDGVSYPVSGEEVRVLLDYARQTKAVVIPYGGGTSVVGHITPERDGNPVLTIKTNEWRDQIWSKLTGSGITGAGILREAAAVV
ncbi:MAG: FAD-binding oxidoreductase [Desulfobacteraceae bacterium]|jgi:FAD/FMN-containing dehydrogenase|nr:FAD-binding oxidoreductase [Desulfobacteraceae bacterium]